VGQITFSQLLLAVSIPTIVALVGVVWNQVGMNALRSEMSGLRKDLYDQVTALLNTIHGVDIRVVRLEEKEKH
jgi:hypothetical protein